MTVNPRSVSRPSWTRYLWFLWLVPGMALVLAVALTGGSSAEWWQDVLVLLPVMFAPTVAAIVGFFYPRRVVPVLLGLTGAVLVLASIWYLRNGVDVLYFADDLNIRRTVWLGLTALCLAATTVVVSAITRRGWFLLLGILCVFVSWQFATLNNCSTPSTIDRPDCSL